MLITSIFAFLIGGALCVVAQVLIDKTSLSPAKILVGFVVFGVFLGAINVFEPLRNFCGCGVSVPLIGFGGNIAKGVKEAVDNMGLLGALGGAFKSAGVGLGISLCLGFFFSLFAKGHSKRL